MGIIDQCGNGLKLVAEELKLYKNIKLHWQEVGLSFQVQFIKLDFIKGQEFQQELGQELQEKRQQYLVRGQELKEPTMFSQILKQLISPKSRQDLVIAFGLKKVSGYMNRTLKRLFEHNLVEHTIPDTPNHPSQKFKLTERGELFLLVLKNKEQ